MPSNQCALDTIICRSDALLSSDIGDDVVMMNIEKGEYYGLEAVAARIWALTEESISVGSLCERLGTEYHVSPEQCQQEVLAFLDELLNHHIVQIVPVAQA